MPAPLALILHRAARPTDPPLTRLLGAARAVLAERHRGLLARAGADASVLELAGPFAAGLAERLAGAHGAIVLGSGSVPLLRPADARRLVAGAASGERRVLTNNRWSSDVLATGDAAGLAALLREDAGIAADNALPRLLAERRGAVIAELPGRDRLALDVDTPLDLALVAGMRGAPSGLRRLLAQHPEVTVPRLAALRGVAHDPRAELLVAGRSGAATLRRLERELPCRIRFLAEERGLRAAAGSPGQRPPRSTLGRLLALRGPEALGAIVAELAEGAVIDTRVLLADRLGADEAAWPSAEDRYASDLLLAERVTDPWLRALTASAEAAPVPILLGSHTLVGPAVGPLLR